MYLLEVLLILLAGSVRWGLLVSQTLLTTAYTVNYFMYLFRGMPFRANDLSAVGTAAKVVGGYDLTPNSHLAFAWALLLLIIAIEWKAKFTIRKIQIRGAVFLAGIAASLTVGYVLLNTEFLENRGFYNLSGFQYLINYKFNGYLVATCMDIRNNKVVKPDGYSEKRVEEILSDNVKPENVQQEIPTHGRRQIKLSHHIQCFQPAPHKHRKRSKAYDTGDCLYFLILCGRHCNKHSCNHRKQYAFPYF